MPSFRTTLLLFVALATLSACAPPETGTPPTLTAEEEEAIMNEVNAVGTQEEAESN